MMSLTAALAEALPPLAGEPAAARPALRRRALAPAPADPAAPRGAAEKARPPSPKPVLQLLPLPLTIDTRSYANAQGNERPNGDLRALYAFRSLADPLPAFASGYFGQGSTEATYANLVHGATAGAEAVFAQQVIAESRRTLSAHARPDIDGAPGSWLPVYASPADWAEGIDDARFGDLDLDLGSPGGDGPYAVIGGDDDLMLRGRHRAMPLGTAARGGRLRMKYLLVHLVRPWLNELLFRTAGWQLGQQPAGFVSSGSLRRNPGVMPLLPMAVLLGRQIALEADWRDEARAMLAAEPEGPLSLGPFPLGAAEAPSTLHVVAWISALVPFSPGARPAAG
ncbi:hypothetical protein [Poseidonocella sp. HB161398]|uniref:hypothetical protein n=1 Tax=Poseidonocella sp. HB161398 TaxID=2320855 RepID=UPI001487057A|nr:hypothetical protein [Poseidonocella sp. HB161398]